MRLIDLLRERGLSNRDAKAALTSGKVYVRDAPTALATRVVEPGDVTVRPNAPRGRPWRDPLIVYRDDHFVAVAKPSGLLSVPAQSRRREPSVLGAVRSAVGAALPVHRIDRGTSGLLLVARTERGQTGLKQLLFEHRIERVYLALVRGPFPTDPIRHETILVRDRGDGLRGSIPRTSEGDAVNQTSGRRTDGPARGRLVDSVPSSEARTDGKRAVSHFRRLDRTGGYELVEARLETGRTHQIRIHLSELGFAVLGDDLYGDSRTAKAAPRLALHATRIAFDHPVTGDRIELDAPLADDLARLMLPRR